MKSKVAIDGGIPVREKFLSFSKPLIEEDDIKSVEQTLRSGWLTTGPRVKEFEEKVSSYIGSKYAVALNSGTAALHLSLLASGIGAGDEVITTPYTFCSTGNVIFEVGARPVFVDINPRTFNIDVSQIEDKITCKTKAIMPVHFAGQPCEMDEILSIARKHKLTVIEDAAHAFGAKYKGRKIGTIGDLTSFSFYPTKNLVTGEGGIVTGDDLEKIRKIRMLSLHGMNRDAWKRYTSEGSWYYEVIDLGYKYNMPDIQASLGISQLKKFEMLQSRRKKIVEIYNKGLKEIEQIEVPYVKNDIVHAWHIYVIKLKLNALKINRSQFIDALKAENIGASVHFIPLHLFPYYRKKLGFEKGSFPNAEYVYERVTSLPLSPAMSKKDAADVVEAVTKIVNYYRK